MTVPAEIAATGFELPASYRRACRLGLKNLEPWRFLEGEAFLRTYAAVNVHDTGHILLPFARRADCGEVACFEVLPRVAEDVRVLQPTTEGYVAAAAFPTFWDWFRQAVEDLIHATPAARPLIEAPEAMTWEWFRRRAETAGAELPTWLAGRISSS